jgi:hypothetical protein
LKAITPNVGGCNVEEIDRKAWLTFNKRWEHFDFKSRLKMLKIS